MLETHYYKWLTTHTHGPMTGQNRGIVMGGVGQRSLRLTLGPPDSNLSLCCWLVSSQVSSFLLSECLPCHPADAPLGLRGLVRDSQLLPSRDTFNKILAPLRGHSHSLPSLILFSCYPFPLLSSSLGKVISKDLEGHYWEEKWQSFLLPLISLKSDTDPLTVHPY